MMRRGPMKPGSTPIKQTAVVCGERIKARQVTKFPARYRKAIRVPLCDLGRYHCHPNMQRIDDGQLATGDAALATEACGRCGEIARVA